MSDTNDKLNTCACCEGLCLLTPATIANQPGLSALVYRVGTHGCFKQSMLTGLSGEQSLKKLTSRDDDDPFIALLDAWATVLDVLSFYQERIANEGYLRTATERRSVLELARHISYKLGPGVAASTYLAFTMDSTTAVPSKAKIPVGTKAQSIPGQGQMPQIFETVEEITARPEWNAIAPVINEKQTLDISTTRVFLKGTDNQLQPGDPILIVDEKRESSDPYNENWDFRILQSVEKDPVKNITLVTWKESLGQYSRKEGNLKIETIPAANPKIFALRQRAFLFGYNAPEWYALPDSIRKAYLAKAGKKIEKYDEKNPNSWNDNWPSNLFKIIYEDKSSIYLDALYPKILKDSWVVLEKPNYAELFKAINVASDSRSEFTLSSKSTRIDFDTYIHLDWFTLRETVVYSQSEPLEMAEKPVSFPVSGNSIKINGSGNDLKKGQPLIISGKLLKQVTVADRTHEIRVDHVTEAAIEKPVGFIPLPGGEKVNLNSGDKLEIISPPEKNIDTTYKWYVKLQGGMPGYVSADKDDLLYGEKQVNTTPVINFANQAKQDQLTSEAVIIDHIEPDDDSTTLYFTTNLTNVYQLDTVVINANVTRATHGETKTEILGSGNAANTFQQFDLKQKPLTYISSLATSGASTTLEIRVNDIKWTEVLSLYGAAPDDRVFITRIDDDGKVTIQFGDGITGARLPTGTDNIKATYRVGTGFGGLLDSRQISLLLTPQLGVKSVINPLSPTGADDPETLNSARQNAPLTTLTMDRIVSLRDYEDFTRAFGGIGKVRADYLWKGEQKVVHLTIASANGKGVDMTSDLCENLITAIDQYRDSNIPVSIDSFGDKKFDVKARILIEHKYLVDEVLKAAIAALKANFSFQTRAFGQGVYPAEVISAIQGVLGVIAVDLDELDGKNPFEKEYFYLSSGRANWDGSTIVPAELLIINPDGISIEEMKV